MKNLFSMILIGITISSAALAGPKDISYQTKIQSISADKNEFPYGIVSGTIVLHKTQKTAMLVLQSPFHCPTGAMCAMMMPSLITIELPITSVTKDMCGSISYHAKKDLRMTDGVLQELTITDNSKFHCLSFARVSPVVAQYTTEGRLVDEKTFSSFEGENFEPLQAQF